MRHDEVGDVVLISQSFRRPLGLEARPSVLAAGVEEVVVAIDEVNAIVESREHRGDRVASEYVVVVEEGHELAGGCGEPVIACGHDSSLRSAMQDSVAAPVGRSTKEFGDTVTRGPVVHDDVFDAVRCLQLNRFEAGREMSRVGIEDRRDHRDQRIDEPLFHRLNVASRRWNRRTTRLPICFARCSTMRWSLPMLCRACPRATVSSMISPRSSPLALPGGLGGLARPNKFSPKIVAALLKWPDQASHPLVLQR